MSPLPAAKRSGATIVLRVAIEFTPNLARRRVRSLKPEETNHRSSLNTA